jgi:hypothetical protein
VPACPEALFSAGLRGTVGGIDTQITARGQTLEDFQRNFDAEHALFDAPAHPPDVPAAAPTGGQPTPEGFCLIHQVQMPLQNNARGSWRSHRLPDGTWCKGK